MTHKPQAPYTLAVKMYGPAKAMYESYPTLREAEKQAVWHIDYVERAQIVIADATGTPVRIHNGNRLEKIEGKHTPAEKMIEEAHTMTQFADDFEITQDQADTLNARIAEEAPPMQYRALNATELKQYVHEHPEFITCPKCEGKAYSDGTENHMGWRVMCCTCNGIGLVTPKEEAHTMTHEPTFAEEARQDLQEERDYEIANGIYEENTTMQTTTKPRQITIATVKKAYQGSGGHFFDKGAMQFFDSRLTNTAYKINDTYVFVTSEQFHDGRGYSAPRMYTVRIWSKGQEYPANVDDVGGFQAHATQAEALDAARRHAEHLANQ